MTKIILAYELLEKDVSKSHIAKYLDVSRRTIIRWSQEIEKHHQCCGQKIQYFLEKKYDQQVSVTTIYNAPACFSLPTLL